MKIKRRLLQICLLCAVLLPATVQAQFTFATNNGTITITGYTGPNGAVVIPNTTNGLLITSIGNNAFRNLYGLTSVTIGTNITSIGGAAFYGCSGLTNVTIGTNVTSIGGAAFQNCYSLPSITIPNSVTSLTRDMFNYSGLTNITIGSGVTGFGMGNVPPFQNCYKLIAINVSSNNLMLSSVAGVLLNKSQNTLFECPLAKAGSFTVPNGVMFIEEFSFQHCTNLTSVTITSSNVATSIGEEAFQGCTRLTNAVFGPKVAGIGYMSFSGCTNLTSVTIPENLNSFGLEAFSGCSKLTAITVDPNNSWYSSVAGVVFDKNQTTVIQFPGGVGGSYTIPDGVTSIRERAFAACAKLTSVTIPDGVTSIGVDAFAGCLSLTDITIPNSVTSIGGAAFAGCKSLTSVTIPDSVTSIGVLTFEMCTSLTNVVIGANVTSIGWYTFYWCTRLSSVYFRGNAPSLDPSGVFSNNNNPIVYYLPGTTGWETFDASSGLLSVLWLPQVQTNDASFGVRTNQFGFNISWANDTAVVVEACAELANPVWSPVGTNTLTGGSSYFSDPDWTNYPGRFYRLRSP